jgi:hypothetical protein
MNRILIIIEKNDIGKYWTKGRENSIENLDQDHWQIPKSTQIKPKR